MARYHFDVEECKIAAWTSTGVYGTAYAVEAISQFSVGMQTTNAQLEGNARVVDVHARQTVGQVTARFAFSDREVYEVMTGATTETVSGTPYTSFSDQNRPYFGICAKSDLTNGDGCTHFFVPKAKVMEEFTISMAYGEYITPEITMMAVKDGEYGIMQTYEYDSQVDISLPPALNGL